MVSRHQYGCHLQVFAHLESQKGTFVKTRAISFSASAAERISSSIGSRYSFPPAPSTTTAVIIIPRRPASPSSRRSSRLIEGRPQQRQLTPERDIAVLSQNLNPDILVMQPTQN